MLLGTIDTINASITSSVASDMGITLYYDTGSITELQEYMIVDDSRFPILWWAKEEGTGIVSGSEIPSSYVSYDNHSLSFILLTSLDIDSSFQTRKDALNQCDEIMSRFIFNWQNYDLSFGSTSNFVKSAISPLYHNSVNAMVGVSCNITFNAPNDTNYCG